MALKDTIFSVARQVAEHPRTADLAAAGKRYIEQSSQRTKAWELGRQVVQELKQAAGSGPGVKPVTVARPNPEAARQFASIAKALAMYGNELLALPDELHQVVVDPHGTTAERLSVAVAQPGFAPAANRAELLLQAYQPNRDAKNTMRFMSSAERAAEAAHIRFETVVKHYNRLAWQEKARFPIGLRGILNDLALSPEQRFYSLSTHPDCAQVAAEITSRQRAEQAAVAVEPMDRMAEVGSYMAWLEEKLFGNPNHRLRYRDNRMRRVHGDASLDLKWEAYYSRIAGTMDERERFVLLWSHLLDFLGTERPEVIVAYQIAALSGGSASEVEWVLDPTYVGDKEQDFLTKAKQMFEPESMSDAFGHAAESAMQVLQANPNAPIGRWVQRKLNPQTYGWAASR